MCLLDNIIVLFVANVHCVFFFKILLYIHMLTRLANIQLIKLLHFLLHLNNMPIVQLKNLSFGYLLCQRSLLGKLESGEKAHDK